jgi:hypothetical protein
MASAVMSGDPQVAFLQEFGQFGEDFAGCCMQLNSLCVEFYSFVNGHVFCHEKEWTEALHAFRESVFKSAEGSRTQRRELYDQIREILLNPVAVVKHSSGQFGQISQMMSRLLQQGSSNPSSSQVCVVCSTLGGAMTKCSGRRCNKVFHIRCAASTLSSKKYSTNFYRCSKCAAVEIKPVKPRKKRNRTSSKPKGGSASGEGDGDVFQGDSATAASPIASNPSSSGDECSAANAAAAPDPARASAHAAPLAVDQLPILNSTSILSNDSSDSELSSSTSADNHVTVCNDITEVLSALHCAQAELSSVQLISQAALSIPQQNLFLFSTIVAEIRDKLSKLTALAVNVEPTHVDAFPNSLFLDVSDAFGTIHSPLSGDDFSYFTSDISIGHSTAQPLPLVTAVIETPAVNKAPAALPTAASTLSGDELPYFTTDISIGHSTAQPLPLVTAVIETPAVIKTPAALPTAASTSASATGLTATFPPTSVFSAMSSALTDSDTRLPLEGWLQMAHMNVCVGMFGVLNRDVLWILPHHCDSIILNLTNASGWSRVFTRYVSNHNVKYVVAFVNVNGGIVDAYSRYTDPGSHWIVSVGNVTLKSAWNYDPQGTQMQHCRGLDILSAVMSHKTASVFKFAQVNCPFKFRCQRSSDNDHCGVWCLMFTLNWCTRTLREYEHHMISLHRQRKNLTKFAVDCRLHFNADLEQGVVDKSMMFWNLPEIVRYNSSFWTVTNEMRLDCFLRDKFSCEFQEKKHVDGKLRPLSFGDMQEGNPWEAVHFYVGANCLVKVYRILLGAKSSGTTEFLAQALHEASATAYVCSKKIWRCEIFGVVTRGAHTSYVHVCIVRSLLCASSFNALTARSAIVDLVRSLRLVHGDPHVGNAKESADSPDIFEVIDFERSFLLDESCQNDEDLIVSIVSDSEQYFDGNVQVRKQLLAKMAKMGLDKTRNRFILMCNDQLSILKLGLDDFLRCFASRER